MVISISPFADQYDDDIDVNQEIMAVIESEPKRPRQAKDVYTSSDESESDSTKGPAVATTSTGLSHAIKWETVKECPLPDPFPLPPHYRADMEIGQSSGIMSKQAKVQFFSNVAASMFTYNKKLSLQERSIQGWQSN